MQGEQHRVEFHARLGGDDRRQQANAGIGPPILQGIDQVERDPLPQLPIRHGSRQGIDVGDETSRQAEPHQEAAAVVFAEFFARSSKLSNGLSFCATATIGSRNALP